MISLQPQLVPLDELDVEGWLRTIDARIIAIGEPNHGSRQPRQLQADIVLAAHAVFPRLVIFGEWCDVEGREMNAYIHGHGTDEAPPRVAGPVSWSGTWDVAWRGLRSSPNDHDVDIFGMRACQPEHHRAEVRRLLAGVSDDPSARIQAALERQPADDRALVEQAESVRAALTDADVPARRVCEVLYQFQLLDQARRRLDDPLFQSDAAMAENVTHVLECVVQDSRAIILAHDGHVAKTEQMLLPNGRRQRVVLLGTALASRFAADYMAVGSIAGGGRFCAVPLLRRRARTTRAYRLEHPRGALEEHLSRDSATPSSWMLDLRSFFHEDDIVGWEKEPRSGPEGPVAFRIHFRAIEGVDVERMQHLLDCHLARSAARGYEAPEMPYCPLVLKGVSAVAKSAPTGLDVVLTVEAASQYDVERRLERVVSKTKAEGAP